MWHPTNIIPMIELRILFVGAGMLGWYPGAAGLERTYTSHSCRHRTNTSHPADTVPPGDHGLTPDESGLYRWYRRPFQEIDKFQFHSTQNPLLFLYRLRWQGNFDISLRVCTSQMPNYEWSLRYGKGYYFIYSKWYADLISIVGHLTFKWNK